MTREEWRWAGYDPLLDPGLDELMWTGALPVLDDDASGPRHARSESGGPIVNDKTKRTVRTVLQVLLGIAVAVPVLLDATGLRADEVPWLAAIVAGAALFARAMQSEAVERVLEDWLGGRLTVGAGGVVEGEAVVVPEVDEHGDAPPGV